MRHLAILIRYVELKDAMGNGPEPQGDGPFETNRLVQVVGHLALVGQQRQGKNRNWNAQSKNQ